jgi:hypothetical protein
VERWPGAVFEIQYDAAQVLLGMLKLSLLLFGRKRTDGVMLRLAEWPRRRLVLRPAQGSLW